MKKTLLVVAFIIMLLCLNKQEEIIIPKESIRFRVIANSNSLKDQKLKKEIVSSLKGKINKISKSSTDINQVRNKIQTEIPNIKEDINKELKLTNYNKNISINYGENYFPKKVFKGITYKPGNYESLVITIGDGIGENFWCVLFPPLCNIDENVEDVEYTSIVKEILNKYLKKA